MSMRMSAGMYLSLGITAYPNRLPLCVLVLVQRRIASELSLPTLACPGTRCPISFCCHGQNCILL